MCLTLQQLQRTYKAYIARTQRMPTYRKDFRTQKTVYFYRNSSKRTHGNNMTVLSLEQVRSNLSGFLHKMRLKEA
jgi:hypothetical protein